MMKRFTRLALACAIVLTMVSLAAAQSTPKPVVRIGDWVEVGNEVWMNVIAINTIRYKATHNYDFEADIQDVTATSTVNSSSLRDTNGDFFFAEVRFGVDFRYKKNLKARVLLETESVFDGNLIDDRTNRTDGTENSPHIERFWIDYSFPGTPIRMRVGANLWCFDIACAVSDDDPGIHFYVGLGPNKALKLEVSAIIQQEAARNGLTNDNDNVYYLFGMSYDAKPHRFGLYIQYQRDRFPQSTGTLQNQQTDTVLIMPAWKGSFGPIKGLFEFLVQAGTAEGTGGQNYDVFSWAGIALLEVDMGMVRPSVGFIFATGDDDPTDLDLGGFNVFNQGDVSLISLNHMYWYENFAYNQNAPCVGKSALCGGGTGYHVITNPWAKQVGTRHAGISTQFSNPGVIIIPVGVKIFPARGHQFQIWYTYVAWEDTALVEAAAGRSISETLMHEVGVRWIWTISKHFDINVRGHLAIPGEAMKDIAETLLECGPTGTAACQGEDVALEGEIQFRSRF